MISRVRGLIGQAVSRLSNPLAFSIRKKKLTYLSFGALRNIEEAIRDIEQRRVPGIFIETGCALGGSTIMIARVKSPGRKLNVYDVFGMIPPPGEKDGEDVKKRYDTIASGKSSGIAGDTYYGYKNDLKSEVTSNLGSFGVSLNDDNIELIQGLYEEVLEVSEPVAFAHVDCDWYSSVMTCLKQIEPHMSPGGVMIIDDYNDWSGCKTAVDEYFTADVKARYEFLNRRGKLLIRRRS